MNFLIADPPMHRAIDRRVKVDELLVVGGYLLLPNWRRASGRVSVPLRNQRALGISPAVRVVAADGYAAVVKEPASLHNKRGKN